MKKFKVSVRQSFDFEIEVEAADQQQAMHIVAEIARLRDLAEVAGMTGGEFELIDAEEVAE